MSIYTYLMASAFVFGSSSVFGQQNLFNVPSSDITSKDKLFFQQQFTIGEDVIQLNSTLSLGVGHNMEVGFNLVGINVNTASAGPLIKSNFDTQNNPVFPFYLFNFQKAFVLNERYKIAIGTQTGVSQGGHFGSYDYVNLVSLIPHFGSKIISGVYLGTDTFLGGEDRLPLIKGNTPFGFQLGLEQPIIKEKLLFIAENISGLHSLGESTIGGAYYLTKHWVVSAGFQFSNPGSKTPEAVIVEFTYLPFSAKPD